MRLILRLLLAACVLQAQEWICPMDPDVRANGPGKCPRCGMKLETRLMNIVPYPVDWNFAPQAIRAGEPLEIRIRPKNPQTGVAAGKFEMVHEKFLHLFIYSSDLEYFSHEHPEWMGDAFVLRTQLPSPGIYKLVADFYPSGGTPQFAETVVTTAGWDRSLPDSLGDLREDVGVQHGMNADISLRMDPEEPIAGKKTLLHFDVMPGENLEPYLGAWGHMLIASGDLGEAMHEHPAIADGGPHLQFDVFFPGAGYYRIWLQVQRMGRVNTVGFTVKVREL